MSFSGFDVGGANLAGSEEVKKGGKLRGKNVRKQNIDPAAAMIEEENAPITDQQIENARKLKDKRQKQNEARKLKQQQKKDAKKQSPKIPTKNAETEPEPVIAEEVLSIEKKSMDLAEVKKKQRELEEQNTLRRRALGTEVANRTKNILAEAAKLKKIEDEIKRLDQLLAYDVSVLRDKIDVASFEYSKAKNRFDAADKEYKESKEDYEVKEKAKDELVDCLMTLIQENEERKKVKLEDLTLKLNMTAEELAAKEEEEALIKIEEEEKAAKLKEEADREKAEEEKIRLVEAEKKRKEEEDKEMKVESETKKESSAEEGEPKATVES